MDSIFWPCSSFPKALHKMFYAPTMLWHVGILTEAPTMLSHVGILTEASGRQGVRASGCGFGALSEPKYLRI